MATLRDVGQGPHLRQRCSVGYVPLETWFTLARIDADVILGITRNLGDDSPCSKTKFRLGMITGQSLAYHSSWSTWPWWGIVPLCIHRDQYRQTFLLRHLSVPSLWTIRHKTLVLEQEGKWTFRLAAFQFQFYIDSYFRLCTVQCIHEIQRTQRTQHDGIKI